MKVGPRPDSSTITFTTTSKKLKQGSYSWWLADSKRERGEQLLATAAYLKEGQNYRYTQANVFARLYGNQSLMSFAGSSAGKMDQQQGLPADRPTFNLIQACVDTLVSRVSQNRPSPVFLTDGGDYKQRKLAKQLNNFVGGEFYQTKAYEKAGTCLRDAEVLGTGCLKVYRTADDRVGIDRVLLTELLVDAQESMNSDPRQLYQLRLVDRGVLLDAFPEFKKQIKEAAQAFASEGADSSKTVSDLVMVVEGWRLKSGKDADDGRHTIACSSGVILDEQWNKDKFPFVFMHFSTRLLGFWAQGLAEQLMGTQLEINNLLMVISKSIKLVGVPRVLQEVGSKVVSAHHNNEVGVIVKWQGSKPEYVTAPCVAPEIYAQLQRLIQYGFQQCGVSALDASSQKPSGLNSGEAIRAYDDISTDRFASLARRYDNIFIDLAHLIVDTAKDIADDTGSYATVYPAKTGTKEIDLPAADLIKDPFVVQVFNMSSLPKDPAGRMQKVVEMIQSGMVSIREGRRLLDFPDLDQAERLANASEERILQYLDMMVEDGEYNPPDSFMDLQLAEKITVQYYNLYAAAKLEEDRCQMLRDFFEQIQDFKTQAASGLPNPTSMGAPGPGGGPEAPPIASPEAPPTSPLLPFAGAPAA